MREVLQGDLARVAKARHPPVHVTGGPCVTSAGPDEEFLAPGLAATYDWRHQLQEQPIVLNAGMGAQTWQWQGAELAILDTYGKITCPACHAAVSITAGDLGSRKPDPYAASVYEPVHAVNANFCNGVAGSNDIECGKLGPNEHATFREDSITCKACRAKRGLP